MVKRRQTFSPICPKKGGKGGESGRQTFSPSCPKKGGKGGETGFTAFTIFFSASFKKCHHSPPKKKPALPLLPPFFWQVLKNVTHIRHAPDLNISAL
jgi:hypothetical protein